MESRVEIFGTLGPACADPEILEKMFNNGMSGMRLNLSHSSLKDSAEMIRQFHLAAERAGKKAELLIDMQGPELRIGKVSHPYEIRENDTVILTCAAGENTVHIEKNVFEAAGKSDLILIDDGKIELKAEKKTEDQIICTVIRGGTVSSKKSIKIIDKDIHGPVLTEMDLVNIHDSKEFGVTALMQPFVTSGEQLKTIRRVLDENGCEDIRIFAKIESREGIAALEDIVKYADMIVIARGDLGNDMPLWELPYAQKQIEKICLKENKPFLVVTQMLHSMIHSPIPTRAEVSDIFNAVTDGCSAVMVTNETAAGDYPAEVIKYLANTAASAEEWLREKEN
jgi:pyruvate kinase